MSKRRGRPTTINGSGAQRITLAHASPALKVALADEAREVGESLSVYALAVLGAQDPLTRIEGARSVLATGGEGVLVPL